MSALVLLSLANIFLVFILVLFVPQLRCSNKFSTCYWIKYLFRYRNKPPGLMLTLYFGIGSVILTVLLACIFIGHQHHILPGSLNENLTEPSAIYSTSPLSSISRANRKIPKIFHQTYVGRNIELTYKQYIAGCLRLNPDWQYYLWRDEDIVAFIDDHFPEFMARYKEFYMNVQRADSIRYMVLHHFGGVYLDMDVECVKPFFPSLANYTAFVDQEAREHAGILYSREFTAMNSAMGSVRGHPFFRQMVHAMKLVDLSVKGAGHTTGPDLLTTQLVRWWRSNQTAEHPVAMLNPEVFSPLVDTRTHNFRMHCARILRRVSEMPSNAADRAGKAIRENACRAYARINWRRDKSNSNTVGRHQFLHLGYQTNRIRLKRFDIKELKQDVRFYRLHKMKPK